MQPREIAIKRLKYMSCRRSMIKWQDKKRKKAVSSRRTWKYTTSCSGELKIWAVKSRIRRRLRKT
jgi:hypothetical protein